MCVKIKLVKIVEQFLSVTIMSREKLDSAQDTQFEEGRVFYFRLTSVPGTSFASRKPRFPFLIFLHQKEATSFLNLMNSSGVAVIIKVPLADVTLEFRTRDGAVLSRGGRWRGG